MKKSELKTMIREELHNINEDLFPGSTGLSIADIKKRYVSKFTDKKIAELTAEITRLTDIKTNIDSDLNKLKTFVDSICKTYKITCTWDHSSGSSKFALKFNSDENERLYQNLIKLATFIKPLKSIHISGESRQDVEFFSHGPYYIIYIS